ncbi:hypothetical protein B0T24DRAFT_675400 [Lasiosphaeria ovina]|uniref:Uncharacterized protein n=1 Tax=Lasiosphaeria ovina TaxID=92902 RepID=A0AAE0NDS5_9PEZI|nr:hypothetical protein B0T24DRAFT_675400 [Lasiosphaeria ovina]
MSLYQYPNPAFLEDLLDQIKIIAQNSHTEWHVYCAIAVAIAVFLTDSGRGISQAIVIPACTWAKWADIPRSEVPDADKTISKAAAVAGAVEELPKKLPAKLETAMTTKLNEVIPLLVAAEVSKFLPQLVKLNEVVTAEADLRIEIEALTQKNAKLQQEKEGLEAAVLDLKEQITKLENQQGRRDGRWKRMVNEMERLSDD